MRELDSDKNNGSSKKIASLWKQIMALKTFEKIVYLHQQKLITSCEVITMVEFFKTSTVLLGYQSFAAMW